MQLRTEETTQIKQYLLGEVAEADRSLIEERLLTDLQYFNQLARIEEEMTDQYVRGRLDHHDHDRFENHFMKAPARHEDVAFARVLHRYVSSPAIADTVASSLRPRQTFLTGTSLRWQTATRAFLAGAALLLIVAMAWLLRETAQLKRRVVEVGTEYAESRRLEQEFKRQLDEQRSRSEDMARQLEISRDQRAQLEREIASISKPIDSTQSRADMVSLTLLPGLKRDASQTSAVNLSPSTRRLRLELEILYPAHTSYRAEVQTAEGDLIWSQDALKARSTRIGKVVVINLPAMLITMDDYKVVLNGTTRGGADERIGTYYFRVSRN